MSRNTILTLLGLTLLATLLLLAPAPLTVQAWAALLLTGLLPGWLLVEALVGRSVAPPPWWERALYAVGAGYGTITLGMLLLSYVPGPLPSWATLAGYGGLVVVGTLWLARPRLDHRWERHCRLSIRERLQALAPRRWLLAGLVALALVGGFFRFTNLGYSEFQGDEARAVERAAAVIQGYDDVLMLHKKGPAEILAPTAIFSLAGTLDEGTARLPFAFANWVALFALWALGWRLLGPVAGWAAALLLALDGYFIGFAHIVQYQSIIFLTSVLVVLALWRLRAEPRDASRTLTLAAWLLATGLLSHYEAVWVVIPAAYALWRFARRHRTLAGLARDLVSPVLVGGGALALFYVPFVLHPNFRATLTYLFARRIGGSFPYNNLADFFIRTTLYSTTYYVVALVALVTVALLLAYWRGLGRRGVALGALAVGALLLTAFNPGWLVVGGSDWIVVLFALALLGAWLAPRLPHPERLLWLWFGIPLLVAFFFTEKPRTHVYVFFIPWALLAGMVVQRAGAWLAARRGPRAAITVGVLAATLAVALFGTYAYWFFVHNRVEVLRTWQENRPPGYWTVYDTPDDKALFGFPLSNGWKVVGALYGQGVIGGEYETNEQEAWVPVWYTRGARRCARNAEWFFQIDNLEPWGQDDLLAMEHYLRQGFQEWGRVLVNGAPRLVIHQRTDEPIEPRTLSLDEYATWFDQHATPDLPLSYPVVAPPDIPNPLHVNLGDEIWLEGYEIHYDEPLQPGDTIYLTLYWRAQKPIDRSYKVFNQVYFGDSGIQAQLDGYPVCDGRETWRWDPGELITDEYHIPVRADATPGLYPLYTGLYLEETLERLPVLDEAGNAVETQIHVTDVRIGEE